MKKHIGLILWLILVIVLAGVIVNALSLLRTFAEAYQANCAETVLVAACEKASSDNGLSLSVSSVPTVEPDGDLSYVLRDGKTPVGRVVLGVKERGPFSLLLYETKAVEGTLTYRVEAPEGVRVSVGTVSAEPVASAIVPGTEPLASFEDARKAPEAFTYEIGGLFTDKVITIEADTPFDRVLEGDTIRITRRMATDEDAEKLKTRAVKLAEMYSKYVSHDYTWETVVGYFMAGSPLRSSLPTMEVQWYATHEKSALANVSIEEPVMLNDRYAYVVVRYDYVITRNGKEYVYPIGLGLTVHLDDDGAWRTALLNPNVE